VVSKKKIPVGIDDFKKVIEGNYYYIDKTLLIKEILDSGAEVTLIPRPRRFGKTLNMMMVRHFFEKHPSNNNGMGYLFKNLKISEYPDIMKHQGQYPVIFMTFKKVKSDSWEDCYERIQEVIAKEFCRHDYLLQGNILRDVQKKDFQNIIDKTSSQAVLESALEALSGYLALYHGTNAIILIDEYDEPIHAGYNNKYFDKVVNFMRNFMTAGFKGNEHLFFGLITGILRVSRESIFSGLNNLKICSITNSRYSDKFGLLEAEVATFLDDYEYKSHFTDVKHWYNGYTFDKQTLYNPWSIINFIDGNAEFKQYWINTSSNDLVKEIVRYGNTGDLKWGYEKLLSKCNDIPLTVIINENIVLQEILTIQGAIWNCLLFTGYLTYKNYRMENSRWVADLVIPNEEIRIFWEDSIKAWFSSDNNTTQLYLSMINGLAKGDVEKFKETFYKLATHSLSYFDPTGNDPERFYHAIVLGMLVGLLSTYEVKSNREAGGGRYDVVLIPKSPNKPGYVFEFKKIDEVDKETLEHAAQIALAQIEEKNYEQKLVTRGITQIIKLGIAFKGKQALIVQS